MIRRNRKYKDSVFTDLFGSDRDGKKNFLDLYNALSGSNYKLDKVKLERKVIEQSLYKTFNNDVSWEIDGKLIVLVEHQSTVNENMLIKNCVPAIFETTNLRFVQCICDKCFEPPSMAEKNASLGDSRNSVFA